jgi:hypothetical protein
VDALTGDVIIKLLNLRLRLLRRKMVSVGKYFQESYFP